MSKKKRKRNEKTKKTQHPPVKNGNAWAGCPPWQFKQSALDFRVEFPEQGKRCGAGRKRLSFPLVPTGSGCWACDAAGCRCTWCSMVASVCFMFSGRYSWEVEGCLSFANSKESSWALKLILGDWQAGKKEALVTKPFTTVHECVNGQISFIVS